MAKTMVKLDRALANSNWMVQYPKANVTNLPRTYSDHSPLVLNLEGMNSNYIPNLANKPFRFLASQMDHCDFNKFVYDTWDNIADLHVNLNNFTIRVKQWNKHTFGNIFL